MWRNLWCANADCWKNWKDDNLPGTQSTGRERNWDQSCGTDFSSYRTWGVIVRTSEFLLGDYKKLPGRGVIWPDLRFSSILFWLIMSLSHQSTQILEQIVERNIGNTFMVCFAFLTQKSSLSEKWYHLKSSNRERTQKWFAELAAHLHLSSAGCTIMRKSPLFPTVSILVTPYVICSNNIAIFFKRLNLPDQL